MLTEYLTLYVYLFISVCDNDLCVYHTAGGLQQTQPTMPQQSYPAAYPGLYQAKYCKILNFSCVLIWRFWIVEILLHFNGRRLFAVEIEKLWELNSVKKKMTILTVCMLCCSDSQFK